MPRARTQSGAPASPPRPPVGVPYGEGERALEAQRRTPVPAGPPSAPGAAGGGAAGGEAAPTDRFAQAVAAAQEMAPPEGVLGQPTRRPAEPVQTGLMPGQIAHQGPEFQDALFDLRAIAAEYPEYRGLQRLIALAEDQV